MATFISADPGYFRHEAYGQRNHQTMEFLQNAYQGSRAVFDTSKSAFNDQVTNVFNRFTSADTTRKLQAIKRNIAGAWNGNYIRPLHTTAALQVAPVVMQRYIMAEPTVRRLWQSGMCDGYSKSYFDAEPGKLGDTHNDYRRVQTDMVEFNEDGSFYVIEYSVELNDGDVELDIYDKRAIRDSWAAVKAALITGDDDPTSKWNASL
jgi:hypothetical protein